MYAFVFPSKDTIYSNSRLDEWKIKRNGKVEYFSGPNENTLKANKEFCEFFTSNHFFSKIAYTKYPLKKEETN